MSSAQPPPFQPKTSKINWAIIIPIAIVLLIVVSSIIFAIMEYGRENRGGFRYVYPSSENEIVSDRIGFAVERSVFYIDADGSLAGLDDFFTVTFDGQEPTARMFDVDGKPTEFHIYTSDPAILKIRHPDDPNVEEYIGLEGRTEPIEFLAPGDVEVKVKVGDLVAKQNIKVVQLDLKRGDPASKVIEVLGFPDEKKEDLFEDGGDHWDYNDPPITVLLKNDKMEYIAN